MNTSTSAYQLILWFAVLLIVAAHFYKAAVGLAGRLKTTGTIALLFDDKQPEKCAVFQRVTLRAECASLCGELRTYLCGCQALAINATLLQEAS